MIMTGGLIQLVAYGYADIFLTRDPQITFFKVVYRRYTNFTIEPIPQYFDKPPNFGKTSTCTIAKNSDLVGNIMLVVTLPKINIPSPTSTYTNKFAWVKRVGHAMLKKIEVEINGNLIDRHYGEWLSVWSELTGMIDGNHSKSYNQMIGDTDILTNFTTQKNEYQLFIPFYFWFCRSPGLAVPIVCLSYSDIKINVEFDDVENCYMLTPTHSIKYDGTTNAMLGFQPNEYLEQIVSGNVCAGIFINYDPVQNTLYYRKITDGKLNGIPTTGQSIVSDYAIVGKTSGFVCYPTTSNSVSLPKPVIKNLSLSDCFLLVDYYFLDIEERVKISQSKHEYIIEQLFYTPISSIGGTTEIATLSVSHPCKLLVWIAQLDYLRNSGDLYNYTNSYQHRVSLSELSDVNLGQPIGNPLILSETILFNGNPRISVRKSDYFTQTQQYQTTDYTTTSGTHMYSFALHPLLLQPTGASNISQLSNLQLQINLSPIISPTLTASLRTYAVCYNVLRIVSGLAALVFV